MQTLPGFRMRHKDTTWQQNDDDASNRNAAGTGSLRLSQIDRVTLLQAQHLPKGGTLGRHKRPLTACEGQNHKNPLFDSFDSLDQPWYRNYNNTNTMGTTNGEVNNRTTKTLSTTAAASNHHDNGVHLGNGSNDEMLERRLLNMESNYVTSGDVYATMSRSKSQGMPKKRKAGGLPCDACCDDPSLCCMGGRRCCGMRSKKDSCIPYEENRNSFRNRTISCCVVIGVLIDIAVILFLLISAFFFSCSSTSWFYQSRPVTHICQKVWENWIPYYKRSFVCSVPPPLYVGHPMRTNSLEETQANEGRDQLDRSTMYAQLLGIKSDDKTLALSTFNSLINISAQSGFSNSQISWLKGLPWDADAGIALPKRHLTAQDLLSPTSTKREDQFLRNNYRYNIRFFHIYIPWDEIVDSGWPFYVLTFDFVLVISLLGPIALIILGELFIVSLSPAYLLTKKLHYRLCLNIPQTVRRIFRFAITHLGGLIFTLVLVYVIKISVGRLSPDFMRVCKPSKAACPFWSQQTEMNEQRLAAIRAQQTGNTNEELKAKLDSTMQLSRGLFETIARNKDQNNMRNYRQDKEKEFSLRQLFTNEYCEEKDILKMKEARTSFPSATVSLSTYATTSVIIYVHGVFAVHRSKMFSITVLSGAIFMANIVLVCLGRIVTGMSWIEDVVAGWLVGFLASIYVCCFILKRFKFKEHVSNRNLHRNLQRIQAKLNSSPVTRRSEFDKYL